MHKQLLSAVETLTLFATQQTAITLKILTCCGSYTVQGIQLLIVHTCSSGLTAATHSVSYLK